MIEREEQLDGELIKAGEVFNFQCGPELKCFNSCCRDKRLLLLPYDIIRLAQALSLPSPEILGRHVELEIDPESGWPTLRLRLDSQGRCPFVGDEGCLVYPHRPMVCRAHPITWAVRPGKTGKPDEIYLKTAPKSCLGWSQNREHTTQSWIQDQGLQPYQQANRLLLPLWFHHKRKGHLELAENQIHAIVMALYNPDVFRQMAAQKGFAQKFALPPKLVKAAKTNDLKLLTLGRDWLVNQLFSL